MGTNFYAIILPTKKRKQELIDAINNDDAYSVKDICEENYNQIGKYNVSNYGILHLGKRSIGWKFLWDPNVYEVNGQIKQFYDFNKESIRKFLSQDNVKIVDEYYHYAENEEDRHIYSVDEFMKIALNWCPDGMDGTKDIDYCYKNITLSKLGIHQIGNDFFSDGLRFAAFTDFS